ncbi:MAG: penicillin-binding protein activator LpoB, partial [Burkholderiales bacterium]
AERKVLAEADKWARSEGARYAIYGAVDEWRYKVGVDGEPAVGVALHIMDLQTNNVVWSGVGGKSGWSRESLSGVAQKLIRQLLASANIR